MALKKNKDGYYRASILFEGKQHYVRAKTEPEAYMKLGELKAKLEAGSITLDKNSSVKQWSERWLETYKKETMTDKSYATYTQKLNKYILPVIGSMKLKDVKDTHLQKILNNEKGGSFSHLSKLRMVMQQMFLRAYRSRLIIYDPAADLVLPDYTKGTHRSITPFEREIALKVANTHHGGLWIKTILFCGARPGETRAMQGQHVDEENHILRIVTAVESGKTEAGIREVPIPDELYDDLIARKHKVGPFGYLFDQQLEKNRGKIHTESSMTSMWWSFKRAMDIAMGATVYRNQIIESKVADDLTPYCFRHTFCTDLQDAGVPLNVAKYLMGHSDVTVTANIYTHTTDRMMAETAQKINAFHGKENDPTKNKISKNSKMA